MRAATASDLAARFGLSARQWTRMAAQGKVPGAWKPGGGKWLFDLTAVERWRESSLRRVDQWQGYTGAAKRGGGAPSVKVENTDSPSAPKIDALLKSAFANG